MKHRTHTAIRLAFLMLTLVLLTPVVSAQDPDLEEAPKRQLELGPPPPGKGFVPPPMDLSYIRADSVPEKFSRVTVPGNWDWRDQGKVTPVGDQGSCGSCYAFAAIGNLESRLLVDGSSTMDFSENNAKECNWYERSGTGGGTSCSGGNYWQLVNLFSKRGTVLESCDPYVPSDVSCDPGCPYQTTILDWRFISGSTMPNPAVLKQYIYEHGPVYTTIYAGDSNAPSWDDEFGRYDGSYTLYYSGEGSPNHAVVIVGWDDSLSHAGGHGGWIVKNSWGTDWGDNGYFTIAYGSAGIGKYSSFANDWQDYDADEEVLYYDEGGWSNAWGYEGSRTAWGLVKFTPTSDITVNAVEFWTSDATSDVDVYVYDDFYDGTSLRTLLTEELNKSFDEPGYHSVSLGSPVSVSSGDDVVAVVKFTNVSHEFPVVADRFGPYETGRTYLSSDGSEGSWTDLGAYADDDIAIRLRASTGGSGGTPEIEVSPLDLEVDLRPDQSTQRTMRIENVGDGNLTYTLYDRETTQQRMALPAAPQGEVDAEGNLEDFAGWDWESLREGRPAALSLDILHYGPDTEPPRFGALGADVTHITDPSVINTSYLNQFDVFHVGYSAEEDYGSLASKAAAIQSYISGGGGVILEQPSDTGYECQFLPSGFGVRVDDTWWPNQNQVTFTPAGQSHPILQGLTPGDMSGNADTVYDSDLGSDYVRLARLVAHPNVIALAAGEYGDGRIVFHTGNVGTRSANPGSDMYVEQMFEWAAGGGGGTDVPWLSESPTAGSVPGGGSQDVTVTFDSTGLSLGSYYAEIVIENNDTDEDPTIVPVTLHVVESGDPVIVTIEDGSGAPGSMENPVTVSADNQTQNTTPIGGAEFHVIYDGSVGLTLSDVNTTGRSSGFSTVLDLDESTPSAVEASILLYSPTGGTIDPGTGPILELLFDVDASADPADSSPLSFSEVLLSDQAAEPIPADYSDTGQFTFGCAKDGDVNDDGSINIFDLQIVINMILHSPQPDTSLYPSDWWCRGDVAPAPNGDGQWNIFDLQRVICLVLGTCNSGKGEGTAGGGGNLVGIGDVQVKAGRSGTFDIVCDNEDAVGAAEVWFTYDSTAGVDVTEISAGTRADRWKVAVSEDESDASAVMVHVLLYNTRGETIEPGSGAILTVAYDGARGVFAGDSLDVKRVNLGGASGRQLSASEASRTLPRAPRERERLRAIESYVE